MSKAQIVAAVERRRQMWSRAARLAEAALSGVVPDRLDAVEEARVLLLQLPPLAGWQVEALVIRRRWALGPREVMAVVRSFGVEDEPRLIRCDQGSWSLAEAESRAFELLLRLAIAKLIARAQLTNGPLGQVVPFRYRDRVFEVPEAVVRDQAATSPPGLRSPRSRQLQARLLIARLRAELTDHRPRVRWNALPAGHRQLMLGEMAELLNLAIREVDRVPLRGVVEPA